MENNVYLKDKIEKLLLILNDGLVGKEKIIKLGILSLMAGENLILIGPPGTAKSEISRRFNKIFEKESYFEYLLTKFTTPEEIFGPFSIKKLQEDKFERSTEGYIPRSKIVFLDEIFKANSSILNTLLTIINEKVFHNGIKIEKIPLISLIGASNEVPLDNEELTALYDRFLVRGIVDYISDEEIEMLLDIENNEIEIPEELKFTLDELEEIRKNSKEIKVSNGIKKTIIEIRREYNKVFMDDKNEIISDRKIVKIMKLLKISAYINGTDKVDFSDILVMINCLWNDVKNVEKVKKIVLDAVKNNITKEDLV